MTAPAIDSVLGELDDPKPCECNGEHPGSCDEDACYAVRLRHFAGCDVTETLLMCPDCLDDNIDEATSLLGAICSECGFRVGNVGDMVGPVIPV